MSKRRDVSGSYSADYNSGKEGIPLVWCRLQLCQERWEIYKVYSLAGSISGIERD
jgi:hypothetical protein